MARREDGSVSSSSGTGYAAPTRESECGSVDALGHPQWSVRVVGVQQPLRGGEAVIHHSPCSGKSAVLCRFDPRASSITQPRPPRARALSKIPSDESANTRGGVQSVRPSTLGDAK